jgi:hypothetical protein
VSNNLSGIHATPAVLDFIYFYLATVNTWKDPNVFQETGMHARRTV